MNNTIDTILNHRSIRKFTDESLTEEQIKTIIHSAQMASTSSNVMAYSIIGITDKRVKEQLYEVSGHSHVKTNAHMVVFCADLHRIKEQLPENLGDSKVNLQSTEQFLVATIDATLAAQNAAVAAESMGLGICYIGSIRNNIEKIDKILSLPDYVIPLYGMVFGYPADEHAAKRPRLPIEAVYHENKYKPFSEQQPYIDAYDEEMNAYYKKRPSNSKQTTWTDQMAGKFRKASRLNVGKYVKRKSFDKQ